MAFETLKSIHGGRRSTSPAIRIGTNYIYLNQFLNSSTKARNVEIQIDKKTSQIRLIFKEKETTHSRRVNKMPSAGVISFKGINELLGLKNPVTIDVQLEGNLATGSYKEKTKPKATLKIAK